jgi:Protein of unknown function (DUF4236)
MAMKYGPNLAGSRSVRSLPTICATCADNPPMSFRLHRSIKLLSGLRLNVGKRGVSTSIAVRGLHVTFGRTGTRTTVGLPGSGLSFAHLDRRRHHRPSGCAANLDPEAPQGSEARGMPWITLIVVILIAAVLPHLAQP